MRPRDPLASLPVELRLLVALTRVALGRADRVQIDAEVDAASFIATVERHRLAPFLQARAAPAVARHCSPVVAATLRDRAAANLRHALGQVAELAALTDALAAAGVDAFTVKGPALAQQLHGGVAARHAGDIDLVIARDEVERADAVLRASGLRRTRPEFALSPRQLRAYVQLKPEFEYRREGAGRRVELLWRLEGLPGPPPLIAVALGERRVHTPALEEHALYLLRHGARHGWFRLFWVVDIAALLLRCDLDWTALHRCARRAGDERGFLQGLALASEWFDVPRPPPLAEARASRGLVREAQRQIARTPRQPESFAEWLRQLIYRLRLSRDRQAQWRVVAPHVFSPQNWAVWRLPDAWFWLYVPAAPFLWAWRSLRRRPAPP
jgi:hypothetical protein